MSRRCPEGIPTIFTGLKRKSRWESVAVEGMARVKEPRSFSGLWHFFTETGLLGFELHRFGRGREEAGEGGGRDGT